MLESILDFNSLISSVVIDENLHTFKPKIDPVLTEKIVWLFFNHFVVMPQKGLNDRDCLQTPIVTSLWAILKVFMNVSKNKSALGFENIAFF